MQAEALEDAAAQRHAESQRAAARRPGSATLAWPASLSSTSAKMKALVAVHEQRLEEAGNDEEAPSSAVGVSGVYSPIAENAGGGDGAGDHQREAEAEALDDALGARTSCVKAPTAEAKVDHAALERAQAEGELQHQREQERHGAGAEAEDGAADDGQPEQRLA